MGFNSYSYIILLLIALLLHHALPWRHGRWALLIASYIFYGAAKPWYCFLLLFTTLVNYLAAIGIHKNKEQYLKKLMLFLCVFANIGILIIFKYSNFIIVNINAVLSVAHREPLGFFNIILPVGISFYTFQSLSYTIDVYRNKLSPIKDFMHLALYVAYFPQLVAGPIERAGHLLPQLSAKQRVTIQDIEEGFQRVLIGLVKKLVLADRLALMVNDVYTKPAGESGLVLAVATFAFAFQIYLDFSGYTDIALGSARLMGVHLSPNFNWPYLIKNPVEFWSRWHMTLTSWFRDYVYRPLGGTMRSRPWRTFLNQMVLMVLIGLWHGASWNFVVFGLINGIYIALYHRWRLAVGRNYPRLSKKYKWLGPFLLIAGFLHINFIMIFFRSANLGVAWQVISGIFRNGWIWPAKYSLQLYIVLALIFVHIFKEKFAALFKKIKSPAVVRAAFWAFLILCIVYGAVEYTEKFIYFQF